MTKKAGASLHISGCRTCELTERRDSGSAPLRDSILRVDGWDVVHSFNTSLEGWIVLVARRHVEAVADLSDDEAADLGLLIKRVSAAQDRMNEIGQLLRQELT